MGQGAHCFIFLLFLLLLFLLFHVHPWELLQVPPLSPFLRARPRTRMSLLQPVAVRLSTLALGAGEGSCPSPAGIPRPSGLHWRQELPRDQGCAPPAP